jgi:hypothetical protein
VPLVERILYVRNFPEQRAEWVKTEDANPDPTSTFQQSCCPLVESLSGSSQLVLTAESDVQTLSPDPEEEEEEELHTAGRDVDYESATPERHGAASEPAGSTAATAGSTASTAEPALATDGSASATAGSSAAAAGHSGAHTGV